MSRLVPEASLPPPTLQGEILSGIYPLFTAGCGHWTVALYSLQGVERKDCGEQKLQQLRLRLLPIFPLQGEDRLS